MLQKGRERTCKRGICLCAEGCYAAYAPQTTYLCKEVTLHVAQATVARARNACKRGPAIPC